MDGAYCCTCNKYIPGSLWECPKCGCDCSEVRDPKKVREIRKVKSGDRFTKLMVVSIGLMIAACVTGYLVHNLDIYRMVFWILGPGITAIALVIYGYDEYGAFLAFAGIMINGCMILFGSDSVYSDVCCIAACALIIYLGVAKFDN